VCSGNELQDDSRGPKTQPNWIQATAVRSVKTPESQLEGSSRNPNMGKMDSHNAA
jgi:hypothetical protein